MVFYKDEAGEGADGEGDGGADEHEPGEGDVRDGERAEVHGEGSLPEPEVEREAAEHADGGTVLRGAAGKCAKKKHA